MYKQQDAVPPQIFLFFPYRRKGTGEKNKKFDQASLLISQIEMDP